IAFVPPVLRFIGSATGASKNENSLLNGVHSRRNKAPKEDGTGKQLTFHFPTIKQMLST
ncbi:MAG: hypothetical protein JWR50_1195, partial [Mucilaginibacter sp.]|nr:hypothetical protein [Mucilaginibacter sp.]